MEYIFFVYRKIRKAFWFDEKEKKKTSTQQKLIQLITLGILIVIFLRLMVVNFFFVVVGWICTIVILSQRELLESQQKSSREKKNRELKCAYFGNHLSSVWCVCGEGYHWIFFLHFLPFVHRVQCAISSFHHLAFVPWTKKEKILRIAHVLIHVEPIVPYWRLG